MPSEDNFKENGTKSLVRLFKHQEKMLRDVKNRMNRVKKLTIEEGRRLNEQSFSDPAIYSMRENHTSSTLKNIKDTLKDVLDMEQLKDLVQDFREKHAENPIENNFDTLKVMVEKLGKTHQDTDLTKNNYEKRIKAIDIEKEEK